MEKCKIESIKQLPVMPLTIEDMTWNKTGTWRLLTPVWMNKIAPCIRGCPIGQPIPQFIQAVLEGDWGTALVRLLEVNPMPGITGRLCYHPCQTACVRKDLDSAVSIKDLERLTADKGGIPRLTRRAAKGRKIAVCGSGPAGLSAAYFLAMKGYLITILEPSDRLGGFLRDLPEGRLSSEVLEREIRRLISVSGLDIETNASEVRARKYDLVLLDRTAYPSESPEARALEKFASSAGQYLDVENKEGGAGFKVVQVAEAVALGRWASNQTEQILGTAFTEESQPFTALDKGELKFSRLPDQKTIDLLERAKGGPDEAAATEAARCLSCGTCNLCQSCIIACPDACCRLDEDEGKIIIDLYHCKGCGICSYECPRGVMNMEYLP
ncbi:MAG: NAD(P)-binding protein [Deltaproteobacteria bacterium]|nr:NAD(P)-binding protein [Deltaproteobacteria bacterium]